MNRYQAEAVAIHAHRDQTDLEGEPYILNVAEVASAIRQYPEAEEIHFVIAWLHAVDKWAAIEIQEKLSVREIEAHIAITRDDDEPYEDYIWRLCDDPVASIVALAVLWSKMRPTRLALLPASRQIDLVRRYGEARKQIWRANRTEWWPVWGPSA